MRYGLGGLLLLGALPLFAGDFLGRGPASAAERRDVVGEQNSPSVDPGLPTSSETLLPPARQPAAGLVEQVDPNFRGSRGPGGPAHFRYTPTKIKNRYVLQEVDPNGPYKHLREKVGQEVSGEELGLGH